MKYQKIVKEGRISIVKEGRISIVKEGRISIVKEGRISRKCSIYYKIYIQYGYIISWSPRNYSTSVLWV